MGDLPLRAILDTSVLIGEAQLPPGLAVAISTVSIAELHFGVLRARDDDERRLRVTRMGSLEARFSGALPFDERVARICGQLQAAVAQRGGNPRGKFADLAIAATAVAHGAVLITANPKDLKLIHDLVVVRVPSSE